MENRIHDNNFHLESMMTTRKITENMKDENWQKVWLFLLASEINNQRQRDKQTPHIYDNQTYFFSELNCSLNCEFSLSLTHYCCVWIGCLSIWNDGIISALFSVVVVVVVFNSYLCECGMFFVFLSTDSVIHSVEWEKMKIFSKKIILMKKRR